MIAIVGDVIVELGIDRARVVRDAVPRVSEKEAHGRRLRIEESRGPNFSRIQTVVYQSSYRLSLDS